MPIGWRCSPRRRAFGPQSARCADFTFQRLEQLLPLSSSPVEVSNDVWRQEAFTIGEPVLQAGAFDSATARADPSLEMIGAGRVQQQYGLTGAGYSVAVLDTGLDYNNPAFAGRYLGGWNFVDNNSNPMDDNGHGTAVAGIIGSDDPRYPGVAPGVDLIALKVLNSQGTGTFGNVDLALQWVIQHQRQYHIAAVNMSLGEGNFSSEPWTFLDGDLQTLKNEGVFIAAAAGNDYYSYGAQPGLAFPAVNNLAVSVGAVWDGSYGAVSWANGAKDYTTAADQIASFSQRNSNLDILAPGALLTSTYLHDGFATMAGTSMSAPEVAGAAVLIHETLVDRGMGDLANEAGILSIMQSTGVSVVDSGHGQDNVLHTGLTFKRLDVLAAIQAVEGDARPPSSPAPTTSAPPADPNVSYVEALYRAVLGRAADVGSLGFWVTALDAGMPPQSLAEIVWTSPEHRQDEVEQFYRQFLQRSPSPSESGFWVRQMLSGANESDVMAAFLESNEFLADHPDSSSFVEALFQDVLARPVDGPTLAAWDSMLTQGVARSMLADAVLHSPEYFADVIEGYYQNFLGRSPGSAEVGAWVSSAAAGRVSLATAAETFLASQEFYERANLSGAVG